LEFVVSYQLSVRKAACGFANRKSFDSYILSAVNGGQGFRNLRIDLITQKIHRPVGKQHTRTGDASWPADAHESRFRENPPSVRAIILGTL